MRRNLSSAQIEIDALQQSNQALIERLQNAEEIRLKMEAHVSLLTEQVFNWQQNMRSFYSKDCLKQ